MCLPITLKLDNIDDVLQSHISELELSIFDLRTVTGTCKIKNFDMYICLNSFFKVFIQKYTCTYQFVILYGSNSRKK